MDRPQRLTVPACVACWAISRPGSCEQGCGREERLDLVGADACDELERLTRDSHARAERLRTVLAPLTGAPPDDAEAAYRDLQRAARAALGPAPPPLPERARTFTTWWCPSCGGIDAPQPCLAICVWRPVEWVAAERHDELREQAVAALDEERRLRALVRRAATVTPRAGRWEQGWAALVSVVTPDA